MIRVPFLFALSFAGAFAPIAAAQVGADEFRRSIDFARDKVYPALVNIGCVDQDYDDGRARRYPSAGSGVIVSPAGHVVTNFHVAGTAVRIRCTLPTGEVIEASRVAADPLTDLCILKLSLESRRDASIPIPFATIGDSDALEVGDHVLAVGNPLTLSSSMTLGIVSNKKRVFTDFTGTEIEEFDFGGGNVTGIFNQWLQHDALILPGNSGGPLVSMRGEIVGINTRGGAGVAFAIPTPTIKMVLNHALTWGEVRRGYVGVSVMPVAKMGRDQGALISNVEKGSPAEAAGLRAGDILMRLAGSPVSVRFFDEVPLLYQRIAEAPAGTKLEFVVERDGKAENIVVAVDRLEKYLGDEREFRTLGLTVREITPAMARARGLPDHDGVIVTGVRAGYPFEEAKPKLEPGHLVRKVDGVAITDVAAFAAALEAGKAKKKIAVVYRNSSDEEMVTLVELKEEDKSKTGKELPRAWLGVQTQVLTDKVAEALGIPGTKGFRVTQVYPWTEAEKGGLKVGDVIVKLDDEPLDASKPQDAEILKRAIEDMSIGDSIELDVLRDGASVKLEIDLQESPTSALDVKSARQEELEFKVRDITFMDKVRYKWAEGQKGVLVTEATSGGWANVGGLRVDDLILDMNGRAIDSIATFEAASKDLVAAKPAVVRFFVRRGHKTHFAFVEPDWAKLEQSK